LISASLEALAALPDDKPKHLPSYILLIERGLVFAPTNTLFGDMPPGFTNYKNANALTACIPIGLANEASGRALMWLFFAVVSKLNEEGLTEKRLTPIIERIEREFRLQLIKGNSTSTTE
jgi:hypothetical protein